MLMLAISFTMSLFSPQGAKNHKFYIFTCTGLLKLLKREEPTRPMMIYPIYLAPYFRCCHYVIVLLKMLKGERKVNILWWYDCIRVQWMQSLVPFSPLCVLIVLLLIIHRQVIKIWGRFICILFSLCQVSFYSLNGYHYESLACPGQSWWYPHSWC